VKVGGRIVHIIGIIHGAAMLERNPENIRGFVEEIKNRKIPLYSEYAFKSNFGYSYGIEVNDHDLIPLKSKMATLFLYLFFYDTFSWRNRLEEIGHPGRIP